jgi:hypothetical protein
MSRSDQIAVAKIVVPGSNAAFPPWQDMPVITGACRQFTLVCLSVARDRFPR